MKLLAAMKKRKSNTKSVGIPRALLYFSYYPFFQSFFRNLGAKVVISKKTDADILERARKITISEFCLPIKVFLGHIDYLKDRLNGQSDYIFIPSLIHSLEQDNKKYFCPKIIGSADIAKATVQNSDESADKKIKYLDLNFDDSHKYASITEILLKVGMNITSNPLKIYNAAKKARLAQEKHELLLKKGFYIDGERFIRIQKGKKIGLIGHPYLIYDSFMNQNIVEKLDSSGYGVITQDNITKIDSDAMRFHWSFANNMENAFQTFAKASDVKGIIYLTPFGCSSDALVRQHMVLEAKRLKKPFMILTYDEHTGEAGHDTRIEAFIDMLK